jgi:DNA repair exonuclease SbcCD ATPase subunit
VIIRSICVEGWRCFANAIEAGPFSAGLNVLYAPNGSGKSTLFEALIRALLDGHRVSGREAEAMRPWGRALAPTVTVEFAHGGVDYRLRKRFLDHPSAELERQEGGQFVRLAQGDPADEKVRQILSRNPPGRGLARPENWGLAQVLWAPQGELAPARLSGELVLDIRACLGAQISGAAANQLEKRVEEIYGQFFTPGGKLKSGREAPALASLREKLDAAREKAHSALTQFQAFEDSARRVDDFRSQRAQARRDAEAISRALADARRRADSYRMHLYQQAEQNERVKSAEAQHGELTQRIDGIKTCTKELQEARNTLDNLRIEVSYWAQQVEEREREAATAKRVLEDVRKDREKVDDARRQAEFAQRYTDSRKAIDELDVRLARITEVRMTLSQRQKERTDVVAPDAKALRAIRKAVKDRDEAQVRIEAALITLEIVPEQDAPLVILSGEDVGERMLHAGIPARIKGSPEVVVDLAGTARIRASGPPGSIQECRDQRNAAIRRLGGLTEGFGTADLEDLESLSERARELDKQVAEAETQFQTLLSGESTDSLEQERAGLAAGLAQFVDRYPAWTESPPDVQAVAETAEAARRRFVEAVENAEAERDKAQSTLTSAAQQKTGVTVRLQETEKQARSLDLRLADLTSDGRGEQEREADLKRAALSWDAAKGILEEIEKKLSAVDGDPEDTVTRLERQLVAADEMATRALEREKAEEGRLEHLSVQGPYSALALAQEEVTSMEQGVAREECRVAAISLLHATVAQCRAEAVAAVSGPVEAAATRTLQRIAGRRLGRVQLSEQFEPMHVVPELAGSSVPLENASGGEREQIYLATRLALAEVLAKEERHLVVLDDVLLATDAGRLARVMSVLEEAAQRLQVLILTCHPERYRALNEARFLDLEAMLGVSA